MFFDGILSCLKGAPLLSSCFHSPLLSSCFYPPSPSDDSINEMVIAETDELAKTIAEIESRRSCFNVHDETDYQIAIAIMDPKNKYEEITIEKNYDAICENLSNKKIEHHNKKEFGFILSELPLFLIVEVPDSEVVGTSASSLEKTEMTSCLC